MCVAHVCLSVWVVTLSSFARLPAALDYRPDAVCIHPASPAVEDEIAGVVAVNKCGAHRKDVVSHRAGDPAADRDHPFLVALAPDQEKASV